MARAEDPYRPCSRARNERSAIHALLRQHLRWLPGAPLSSQNGELRCLVPTNRRSKNGFHVLSLTGKDLAFAKYAIKNLRQYPSSSLRKWIDHPADWLCRAEHLIDVAAKDNSAAPTAPARFGRFLGNRWQRRFETVWNQHPRLRDLLHVVGCLQLSDPGDEYAGWLDWIAKHADGLEGLRVEGSSEDELQHLQIKFCMLSKDVEPAWLEFLLRALGHRVAVRDRDVLLEARSENRKLAKQLSKACKHPKNIPNSNQKPTKMENVLAKHLEWLLAQKPKRRKAASQVLQHIADQDWFADTERYLEFAGHRASCLRREISSAKRLGPMGYVLQKHYQGEDLDRLLMDDATYGWLFKALSKFALCIRLVELASAHKQWSANVVGFLAHFVGLVNWRTRVSLLRIWADDDENCQHRSDVMRCVGKMLQRRGPSSMLLQHWLRIEYGEDELISVLDDETTGGSVAWSKTLGLLESIAYQQTKIPDEILCNVAAFAQQPRDAAEACMWAVAARFEGLGEVVTSEVRLALQVTQDPNEICLLLPRLDCGQIEEAVTGIVSKVGRLCEPAETKAILRLTYQLAIEEKKRPLREFHAMVEAIDELGARLPPVPKLSGRTEWAMWYPKPLHDGLRQLELYCKNPVEVADGILRRDFPTEKGIESEINKINRKLAEGRLPKITLDNLERCRDALRRRSTRPKNVSEKRMANLVEKVQARTIHEYEANLVRLCKKTIEEGLRQTNPEATLSPRLFDVPNTRLVLAVLRESRNAAKEIGISLLLSADRVKKNAKPLAAQNQDFVDRMTARGINMSPWMENQPRRIQSASGEDFELGFATDPLDLMLMGFYFDTCLSPDSFNFYSAITNTIDANKQVLYCRRLNGQIVGRCLFAMTGYGMIQTYRRYLHDAELDWNAVVDEFARELARDMGTCLTSHGRVKPLVAKDWYDDGAIAGGLDVYSDGKVDELLNEAKPSTLVASLLKLFGCRETLINNLEFLLKRAELVSRVDLFERLVDEFGLDRGVDMIDRMRMAVLVHQQGNSEQSRKIISELGTNDIAAKLRSWRCRECPDIHEVGKESEVLACLLDCDWRIAQRFLLLTRPRRVKSADEETRACRRQALSVIYKKLGQQELAQQLA